jgi:methylaspartate mutase epsilon subunit
MPINRESFGPLSATLQPPAIVIAIQIIELLLSLEEGVKSFSVSFSQSGSMIQDIVTGNVIRKLSRYYANTMGFNDADIHLVYHQWMGAFPYNKEYSDALITASTVIAAIVGADKIITKTRNEAFGIPTKEANARAVSSVQYTLNTLKGIPNVSDEEEEAHLECMVREIMDTVLNNGADTLWRKVFNSIKEGIIEIPFSPHIINANRVISIRDPQENIRILKRGKLPISDKSYEYEKRKINLKRDERVVDRIIEDIGIMQ